MNYYTVPATGSGTDSDPIRPHLVTDVDWVGAYDANTNSFLIASTAPPLPANTNAISNLQNECQSRGLIYDEVMSWFTK